MESSSKKLENTSHLSVIKNLLNGKKSEAKIYINTLVPGFTYKNSKGETVTPKGVAY